MVDPCALSSADLADAIDCECGTKHPTQQCAYCEAARRLREDGRLALRNVERERDALRAKLSEAEAARDRAPSEYVAARVIDAWREWARQRAGFVDGNDDELRGEIDKSHSLDAERIAQLTEADQVWREQCVNLQHRMEERRDRIAELEAHRDAVHILLEAWRDWANNVCMVAHTRLSDSDLRVSIGETEEKLRATVKELEAQLAAAKPVLTAEERTDMHAVIDDSHFASAAYRTANVLLRLCPPPKEPPTLDELAERLVVAADSPAMEGCVVRHAMYAVADALRARACK